MRWKEGIERETSVVVQREREREREVHEGAVQWGRQGRL